MRELPLDQIEELVEESVFHPSPCKRHREHVLKKALQATVRQKISFVHIATKAGIHEIVVTVVSARRDRDVVIYRQLTARVGFRHSAVTAPIVVALAHLFVLRMSHSYLSLTPSAWRIGSLKFVSNSAISALKAS